MTLEKEATIATVVFVFGYIAIILLLFHLDSNKLKHASMACCSSDICAREGHHK